VSNPLDPEVMSPAERLEEAASLLASGLLRHRLRGTKQREKSLDVLPDGDRSRREALDLVHGDRAFGPK
jgi:hypothetical protein